MDDLISRAEAIETVRKAKSIGQAHRMLMQLPPAQQWIPCSEVPDTDRNVFIARGDGNMMTVCVGHYRHDYKQWYEDRNWFAKCLYDGLYWCEMPPLPEPWKGGPDEY